MPGAMPAAEAEAGASFEAEVGVRWLGLGLEY